MRKPKMYKHHSHCRACGYGKTGAPGIKSATPEKLVQVLHLGVQALANDFCPPDQEHAGFAPLILLACPRCMLGQLSVTVNPATLYRHYSYVTSPSKTMREHLEHLIEDIQVESKEKLVVEIGSNDGRFLSMMRKKGYTVLGVDPAQNLAEIAKTEYDVDTRVGLFGAEITANMAPADIVIARHVFCHIDNWQDFLRGLENISHSETLICIEVPHAQDMIEKCEFDTVYHEHLSYMTLSSMEVLLKNSMFHIHNVIKYPIHGGAILIMLRRNDSRVVAFDGYPEDISMPKWLQFGSKALEKCSQLQSFIVKARMDGKRVAGLGASAKSTVWVNSCKLTKDMVEFIADATPQKQYTTSPGSNIPIVDEGAILRELPDYVIVFCWNFREEVLSKFAAARAKGVKFIFPVPDIEVV